MTEELLKKYIYYFGDKPPFPPKHIMESLVRMKDDGTFDEKLKAVSSISDKVRSEIEEVSGEKMSINHPVYDYKFDWKKINLRGNLWIPPNTFKTFFGVIYVTVQLRHLFDIVKKGEVYDKQSCKNDPYGET